jgi:diguanylate cyclase (GGDEF)-like protein
MSESKTSLLPNFDLQKEVEKTNTNNDLNGIPIIQSANKVEKLIYNDTLTGFENRRGLKRYKDNLKTDQYPLTMLTFDLDNLKKINDNPDPIKGTHKGGDAYILSSVKFFNEIFPDTEKVRLGGDEFAIVIPKDQMSPEATEAIEKMDLILEAFNQREQNPNELKFTYALSIASSDQDFYPALERSDLKLVEAKKIKKSQ